MACNFPYILYRTDPVEHIIPVPCGRCEGCRRDRIDSWCDRIAFESLTQKHAMFLTLTYDDSWLPPDRSVHLRHVQLFNKLMRYYLKDKHYRFFCSSEYGELNYRPHYHLCVMGLSHRDIDVLKSLACSWKRGFFKPDGLITPRIRYCVKYISKEHGVACEEYARLGLSPLFHSMSKGIGAEYVLQNAHLFQDGVYYVNGKPRPMLRFFKEKLGIYQKYEYLNRLPDIWHKYNDVLSDKKLSAVDPFQPRQLLRNGWFDSVDADNNSRLRMAVADLATELHMLKRESLRT